MRCMDTHDSTLFYANQPSCYRYGDESKLAHVTGVIQALVSVVAQENDQLQTLVTADRKMVFRTCGHLILVAVSSSEEPTSHLGIILKYVYNQVRSSPFHLKLKMKCTFCLRLKINYAKFIQKAQH